MKLLLTEFEVWEKPAPSLGDFQIIILFVYNTCVIYQWNVWYVLVKLELQGTCICPWSHYVLYTSCLNQVITITMLHLFTKAKIRLLRWWSFGKVKTWSQNIKYNSLVGLRFWEPKLRSQEEGPSAGPHPLWSICFYFATSSKKSELNHYFKCFTLSKFLTEQNYFLFDFWF